MVMLQLLCLLKMIIYSKNFISALQSNIPSLNLANNINLIRTKSRLFSTKLFYNDVYEVKLPANHRFPMEKYRIVRESLQSEYSNNKNVSFEVSPLATALELSTTHCPHYIDRYLSNTLTEKENRKIGFPWSLAQVQRTTSSVGGTIAAMRHVLNISNHNTMSNNNNIIASCHLAGGTHHAFYDYGEGFCIFSDIACAANIALVECPQQVKNILIIDLDVHQGNGNAVLFAYNPHVFTFSMHCSSNYFSEKQISDLDIEVSENTQDKEYLQILQSTLPTLLEQVNPDLVFYQAGVDIHHLDKLGRLSISRQGIHERNLIVYNAIKDRNLLSLNNTIRHRKNIQNHITSRSNSNSHSDTNSNSNNNGNANGIYTNNNHNDNPSVNSQSQYDTTTNSNNSNNRNNDDAAAVRSMKLVVTMGGGYPKDMNHETESFREIMEAHKDVYRDCIETFSSSSSSS